MRALLILAALPAIAQIPVVRFANTTRPAANEFQIGDRYEIVITGAPNQPVSVRTTTKGGTDWSPVIGSTDAGGRWSTAGLFEKRDFGSWSEIWTVGGKLASPAIHFWVAPPCRKEGQGFAGGSGPNQFVTCETAEGRQTFVTRSDSEPFRTPDGRVVPGRMQTNMTTEEYHAEIIEYLITAVPKPDIRVGPLGDEAGDTILKMIGPNALSDSETENVLSVVRAAFEKPESIIRADARDPSRTLLLLRKLSDLTERVSLKQQIAATIAWLEAR